MQEEPKRAGTKRKMSSSSSSSSDVGEGERSAAGGGEKTPVPKKKSSHTNPGGGFFGNLLKPKKTSANRKGKSPKNKRSKASREQGPSREGGASREQGPSREQAVPKEKEKKEPVFEKPGGDNYQCIPQGMKATDFARPEGAGTDFVLDLGPPKPATPPAPAPAAPWNPAPAPAPWNPTPVPWSPGAPAGVPPGGQVKAMDLAGGQNMASLPPGAKPEDFARPEGAGTDFVLDLGPPKPAAASPDSGGRTTTTVDEETEAPPPPGAGGQVNAMEVAGGRTMAALPPGTKPEDFARPADAGTGFVLDLGLPPPKNPCGR